MLECERGILASSRWVLGCSHGICDEVRTRADPAKVLYWPHRVEAAQFLAAAARKTVPADLRDIPRPVIGYYGTLTDSNDWETLAYCATRRPQYSFVLVGRKEIAVTGTEHLSNVHFLGVRPYREIGDYGAAFDVAVMFWVRRDWIKNCSPLKLKEYLALGKPVVSTRIEEVEREFGDIVFTAETPEQFLRALDRAVREDLSDRIRRGVEKVRGDSWDEIRPLFAGLFEAEGGGARTEGRR
jgi:glycosyltransferase involved in cell wall biosynthesis